MQPNDTIIKPRRLQSTPIAGTSFFWAYAMYGDNQLHSFSAGVINVAMYADLYPVWLLRNATDIKPMREFRYPREAILYAQRYVNKNKNKTVSMKERLQCLKQKSKLTRK